LEHVIISHQRLPEWGSPKPPMTPEALLVHYADDIDAKYHMMEWHSDRETAQENAR
jgi:3'-5' exoribonuclease